MNSIKITIEIKNYESLNVRTQLINRIIQILDYAMDNDKEMTYQVYEDYGVSRL